MDNFFSTVIMLCNFLALCIPLFRVYNVMCFVQIDACMKCNLANLQSTEGTHLRNNRDYGLSQNNCNPKKS